jgi:DNA primase
MHEIVIACPTCGQLPPGLTIDEEAGVWRCACGEHGDLFDYVMKRDGVTFGEALRDLGEDAGLDVTGPPEG